MIPSPPDAIALAQVRRLCSNGAAKTIREQRRVSLREIATQAQVSKSAISAWELGRRRPTGASAVRYLGVLMELAEVPVYQ